MRVQTYVWRVASAPHDLRGTRPYPGKGRRAWRPFCFPTERLHAVTADRPRESLLRSLVSGIRCVAARHPGAKGERLSIAEMTRLPSLTDAEEESPGVRK